MADAKNVPTLECARSNRAGAREATTLLRCRTADDDAVSVVAIYLLIVHLRRIASITRDAKMCICNVYIVHAVWYSSAAAAAAGV